MRITVLLLVLKNLKKYHTGDFAGHCPIYTYIHMHTHTHTLAHHQHRNLIQFLGNKHWSTSQHLLQVLGTDLDPLGSHHRLMVDVGILDPQFLEGLGHEEAAGCGGEGTISSCED